MLEELQYILFISIQTSILQTPSYFLPFSFLYSLGRLAKEFFQQLQLQKGRRQQRNKSILEHHQKQSFILQWQLYRAERRGILLTQVKIQVARKKNTLLPASWVSKK